MEEETAENKRITAIVGGATACIFLAAFILIAVTLKMTPKIDEICKFVNYLSLHLFKLCSHLVNSGYSHGCMALVY